MPDFLSIFAIKLVFYLKNKNIQDFSGVEGGLLGIVKVCPEDGVVAGFFGGSGCGVDLAVGAVFGKTG